MKLGVEKVKLIDKYAMKQQLTINEEEIMDEFKELNLAYRQKEQRKSDKRIAKQEKRKQEKQRKKKDQKRKKLLKLNRKLLMSAYNIPKKMSYWGIRPVTLESFPKKRRIIHFDRTLETIQT